MPDPLLLQLEILDFWPRIGGESEQMLIHRKQTCELSVAHVTKDCFATETGRTQFLGSRGSVHGVVLGACSLLLHTWSRGWLAGRLGR